MSAAGNKLPRVAPAWHEEAAERLRQNFSQIHIAFMSASRKAVSLGFFLNYIRAKGKADKSIPHGSFKLWIEKNVPEISYEQITRYMAIGRGVQERAKLTDSNIAKCNFCLDGTFPDSVEEIVSEKNQQQLLIQFRQTKIVNDVARPKRDHRKGQGDNPAEILGAACQRDEALRIEAVELDCETIVSLIDKHCDDRGFGCISADCRQKLSRSLAFASSFLHQLG